jgi:hypothetical protein
VTGVEIAMAAAVVVAAAGTAYTAHQQAEAQEYTEEVAELDAETRQKEAAVAEQVRRQEIRRQQSAQRAAYAVAGVVPEGSPLELAEETAILGELDALTVRYQGAAAAQARRARARLARFEAGATRAAGAINTGATLLGGAARVYGMSAGDPYGGGTIAGGTGDGSYAGGVGADRLE